MLTDVLNERNIPYIAAIVSTGGMIAALGAWWLSWRECRRNNRVIVELRRFCSQLTETAAGRAYELEIWVVNTGIQMQNISIALDFAGPGKSGNFHLPIPLSDLSKRVASSFLRGTMARFLLSTADKNVCQLLGDLRDFDEQRPVINIYNSSFLVCSFPIYRRCDGFRKLWNRLSFRLSFRRRVGDGHDGKGVFKMHQLPYFVIRSDVLRLFLDGAKNDPGDEGAGGAVAEGTGVAGSH